MINEIYSQFVENRDIYLVVFGGASVGVSFVTFPVLINQLRESVETGLKARFAANCIAVGDSVANHRWAYDDVRIDPLPLARLVVGKKRIKLLEEAVRDYENS